MLVRRGNTVTHAAQNSSEGRGPGIAWGGAEAGRPGRSDEISLSDLVRVLRRRKPIIAASVIVVFLLGVLYCAVKTRRYEAVADLAINPEGSDALDMGDITASLGGGGLGFDEKLETQVHVLKSDSLAWTVISELQLDKQPTFAGYHKFIFFGPYIVPDPPPHIEQTTPERRNQLLAIFGAALTVQTIARTQAVEITFRNANPNLARDIVNHLVSGYTQRTFMTRYNDTMKASDWLSGQLAQLKAAVEQSQSKLSRLQKQTGIFGTDENDNLVLSKLDDLSKELTDAESDRIVKEAKYRVAQSGNPELIGTVVPDSVLPILRGQQADLETQLAQANAEYGPRYPKVTQLESQLAQVEKSLQKEIADIQERFRTDYQISEGTEEQLQAAFDGQKQQAYAMSEGLDQYGILKREVESSSDLYDDLLKKLKEAGVVASLKAATVDIIDPATLPTKPVEPNIPLVLALSILLGLGAGIACTLAAENLDNLIRSPEEVEFLTGVPLFGMIPHIKGMIPPTESGPAKNTRQNGGMNGDGSRQSSLVTVLRPTSQASEGFRALRTALLLASAGTPPKTILIASAVPGEGKTTVSMNIAAALSQRTARVLLIDADLRRGALAERLEIPKNLGLSGSLTGAGNWRDAVAAMPNAPNLFVLQAGPHPPNSAELLGSVQMHRLLEECKAEYDHVIIDSAPCLVVTDAVLVAQKTDVVLLVSRIGVTPRGGLHRASELLQFGEGHLTGIVVNDVRVADHYYGYGYGYGKYNGYYSEEGDRHEANIKPSANGVSP
jgi:polysaccharide biosynthesis transport protein